jgi:hypothetical protein
MPMVMAAAAFAAPAGTAPIAWEPVPERRDGECVGWKRGIETRVSFLADTRVLGTMGGS